MFIFKRVAHLQDWVQKRKMKGLKVGFVPTMGALHKGHLSLVERSREESGMTIVSIFVNPKQFNDPQDLVKYPKPTEQDLQLLYKSGVDVVFLPEVEDIYPETHSTAIDFDPGPSALTLEGEFRPGHFSGMAEVVHRLLKITDPDNLYMGQKDFQQFSIIRKLISDFKLPVHLVMCPTVREESGLAMSSRNVRLSPEARARASVIHKALVRAKESFEAGVKVEEIRNQFFEVMKNENFTPEYMEVVDGYTLAPVKTIHDAKQIVACCAVYVEDVRLIDNIIWKDV
jgi:pantoate--beta-alanine ligase